MNTTMKTVGQIVIALIVAYGFFAVGSYDARNELTVLTPNHVAATGQHNHDPVSQIPSVTAPNVTTPSVGVPGVSVPAITTPSVNPPAVTPPKVTTPSVSTGINVPSVTVPNVSITTGVNTPSVGVPTVTVPNTTVPGVTVPTVTTPGVTVPNTTIPGVTIPGTTVPSVTVPGVTVPGVTIPGTTVPTVTVPGVTIPGVTIPTVTPPTVHPPTVTPNATFCNVTSNLTTITTGGSVTLTWDTQGFDTITINGEAVTGDTGSKTFDNIQVNTTYKLVAKSADGNSTCTSTVYIVCVPASTPVCEFTPKIQTINKGETATLTWDSTNADSAILEGVGSVDLDGTYQTGPLTSDTLYKLIVKKGARTAYCHAKVKVVETPIVPACEFNPAVQTVTKGDFATLTWTSTNADSASIVGLGAVQTNGSVTTGAINQETTFKLIVKKDGKEAYCHATVKVVDTPAPTCDRFEANPSSIDKGQSSILSWDTTNATKVTINNGLGEVDADSQTTVTPASTITYLLTAYGVNGTKNTCETTVTVKDDPADPVPECKKFVADKYSLPAAGGDVQLTWETLRANTVEITPQPGSVSQNGTQTVNVVADTVFLLTARDTNGDEDTCSLTIDVADPNTPISCSANVDFTASNNNIEEGDQINLSWTTNGGINSVSIDNGISSTALNGNQNIKLDNDTVFTLTASDGTNTIQCPLSINVREDNGGGGGGGGSSSPRCELDISDTRINRGEEITLTWETNRASEIKITDNNGKTYIDTDDLLGDDKDDLLDGEITLEPNRDTTYTLLAERGSRDRECTVRVTVEGDDVIVQQVRDLQPLVAGISLSQTPYTGFEAGPILTMIFYTLLAIWTFFITYILVVRKESLAGISLGTDREVSVSDMTAQERAPELFVENITAPVKAAVTEAPAGLPVGLPTGDFAFAPKTEVVEASDESVMEIENRAHAKNVLLSTEAIETLMNKAASQNERLAKLDTIIDEAKASYPSEDGWVVVNQERLTALMGAEATPEVVAPQGSGSLAEAIVSGNVVAAYEMIGNRPMVALADAATELDTLYRKRQGEQVAVSNLLDSESTQIESDQIKDAIEALTGALDGTYNTEAEAVKMAIMKAVKALS